MSFSIVIGSLADMEADAIAYAASSDPMRLQGAELALFRAAGLNEAAGARKKLGVIEPGQVLATSAFALKARLLLHASVPQYHAGDPSTFTLLQSCCRECFRLAAEAGCKSIAMPMLGTGIPGFPSALAFAAVRDEYVRFRDHAENEINLTLVVSHRGYLRNAGRLRERPSRLTEKKPHRQTPAGIAPGESFSFLVTRGSLEDAISRKGESFAEMLLRLITERGLKDPEVYREANVSRQYFSRIRCTEDITPAKKTVVAFALALRLNIDEALDLLDSAGYTLTDAKTGDLIARVFIEAASNPANREETGLIFDLEAALQAYNAVL